MNHLHKIVASVAMCEKIIGLGIEPVGLSIWHVNKPKPKEDAPEELEDNWTIQFFEDSGENAPEYWEGLCVPAWTKEEIETMTGPEYNHSDLKQISQVGYSEIPKDPEERKNFVPDYFVVYLLSAEHRFKNGADAAACELVYALEKKIVHPHNANRRYKKIYLERE